MKQLKLKTFEYRPIVSPEYENTPYYVAEEETKSQEHR